jgi:predicted TIM-barrel fold metal-dependent hydrolase
MRIFDCHSHWATEGRSVRRTDEDWRHAQRIWKMERKTYGDEEQADYFRNNNARTILDLSYTKTLPIEEMRRHHDYALAYQRRFSEVVFGHWLQFEPQRGAESLDEFQRCLGANSGFVGFCVNGQVTGVPPSDPLWDPFYKRSIDVGVPVMILCGLTGIGQGHRGGKGIVLDHGNPRHIACAHSARPECERASAARHAYPWQDDDRVLLSSVQRTLRAAWLGSSAHFTPLKKEIRGACGDRIMFGCDFPGLLFERVIPAWHADGYSQEVLEKVLHRNAEAFFPAAAKSAGAAPKELRAR